MASCSQVSFRSRTISPAGALGIAQFIPETAVKYGLMNPFEPLHALFAAGKLLRRLNDRFGNLGLAAAAYNAGPQRVRPGWPSAQHCPAKPTLT
jgi:soluble lytic murein transglycosylase-like protein